MKEHWRITIVDGGDFRSRMREVTVDRQSSNATIRDFVCGTAVYTMVRNSIHKITFEQIAARTIGDEVVEVETSSAKYTWTFRVCGRGSFPYDMLRRESCTPTTADDSRKLYGMDHFCTENSDVREIGLTRCSDSIRGPDVARWKSFGWVILPESLKRV